MATAAKPPKEEEVLLTYPVIDTKTDTRKFWGEHTAITLTLVQHATPGAKFGVLYGARWSGPYHGTSQGGPYPVSGNKSALIHRDPKIAMRIEDYQDTGTHVSFRVIIVASLPFPIGHETLFDDTLSGNYPVTSFEQELTTRAAANTPKD